MIKRDRNEQGAKPTPRRHFLKQALAAGVAAAAVPLGDAAPVQSPFARQVPLRIKSAVRRDETIVRYGGDGDVYPMTWMSDDRQLSSFSDGCGWSAAPKGVYNTRAIVISGGPSEASIEEVVGYPELIRENGIKDPGYYGFGTLAAEERLYHFLSCAQEPSSSGWGWNGVKLIYSRDRGNTWHNQDGSTPVVWESFAARSQGTMLFFEEPQEAFSLVSLLQMGKNYEANRDGYVYGYGTNGNTEGNMNQLVMFRVPTSNILDRTACEFFAGMKSNHKATWAKDIRARAVVHTFPRGWVNVPREGQNVVQSWIPSVAYVAPLGLYLMANSGVGCASDADWFDKSKPSYLGFWTATNPWGPWSQIHEDTAWMPDKDTAARCYSPQIAPKWTAPDGKSFWLVWSDYQKRDHKVDEAWNEIQDKPIKTTTDWARFAEQTRRSMPYYSFNTQRYDLKLA
jgi:hypothetical protein